MTPSIDDLLARAAIPTSGPRGFDVPAALRRLAADAGRLAPQPELERAGQAGQLLSVVSRWVLNRPDAAAHMEQIAGDPDTGPLLSEDQMSVDGALVFACLLHLTGHPESSQFWWQFAAGADSRTAAYCLHLHHRRLGEARESRHWYTQVTAPVPDGTALDDAFIGGLEAVARYVRRNGSAAWPPTKRLEGEVDRLAARSAGSSCVIVRWPDRRLAEQLHRFITRRT
ncbi:hypothetical protein [Streptomyces sp. NPDC020965]|uniref:hypothetical protein n=1 Tax=Streptomyces sp. NPDC020965 TaxID=3365105 RepID=UPI00379CEF51